MNLSQNARLLSAIIEADRNKAEVVIDEWGAEFGFETALRDFIEPVLKTFGETTKSGSEYTLAQGYVAAKIVEYTLLKISASSSGHQESLEPTEKGPIIMGNIEDDFHALGRKIVSNFLISSGWRVIDLGDDVAPSLFVDTAVSSGSRVIGVSAMMYTTAMNIKRLRAEIDKRGLAGKLNLAVGGAVFVVRPDLVEEVGGDGTAANALDSPALMASLWNESQNQWDGKI